ncbi:myelin-oligodendrocyte glycoprotein-like isoform X2 [Periophthalmus magnuspinnatus]|uniref:myelin-oligodendrocyte glycoprotein-like isoform X2 n=1 Tax=Periophthalmus magnuspinnatus TaxID=409849 RepID=UPI00145A6E56|nr:myelin-oligodendrocyte glycoprotein-like isoform X2 [Periophthalmus magnuspinnatus]
MWTYVFFLVVIIVSPALSTDYEMVGHDPVVVEPNKDAILSCHVEPETNLTQDFMDWHVILTNGNDNVVYSYRRGKEILSVDDHFKNRTEILKEILEKGDISFKIRNVKEDDDGNYICVVEIGETKRIQSSVKLIVRSKDDPSPLKDSPVSSTAPSPSSSSPPPGSSQEPPSDDDMEQDTMLKGRTSGTE